jgi:hypothetical protein
MIQSAFHSSTMPISEDWDGSFYKIQKVGVLLGKIFVYNYTMGSLQKLYTM